jgi:hypothetical protein
MRMRAATGHLRAGGAPFYGPVPTLRLFLNAAEHVNILLEPSYQVAWPELPEKYRAALDAP